MRILTRYLIRAHVGPFLFAVTALTGLLFLNAVAQRLEDLAGKGLTWDVIVDFLVLSLPHTVALTLPMAVLVAVLYAFSDLAANNEVTAMKAGGVRPQRLLVPLLGMGTVIALVMLFFNDRVLPEANHQLKNLLLDINRKSPTFTLREQVVNRIEAQETGERFFLQAARIDNTTSALYDVVIVDSNDPMTYRTTVADSGFMAFNEQRTDLYLTLFDGVAYESPENPPGGFQTMFFDKQVVPIRGIGNEMERRVTGSDRGDREMSIAMLADVARSRRAQLDSVREENRENTKNAVLLALGHAVPDTAGSWRDMVTMTASTPAHMAQGTAFQRDHMTRRVALNARSSQSRVRSLFQTANRYEVEIHKKISLAVACIVFVLLGAPLAVRFPRGGLGLVIAASSAIFAVYWIGLIGGESLSDRGIAPPWATMWFPNVVFTILGLMLVKRMGRESATMRGGGWDDLKFTLQRAVTSPFRREVRSARPQTRTAA